MWSGGAVYLLLSFFLRLALWQSLHAGLLSLLADICLLASIGCVFLDRMPGSSFSCSVLALSTVYLCTGIAQWASFWLLADRLPRLPLPLVYLSDTLRELLALLLFFLLAWIILRFFQKSIASASQSVLFLLAVPVFFITLVEQLVLHQIYGDTIVLDGQGIVSPVIDHPEMLLLQLFACACLLLSLAAFQKLSTAILARQRICLLEQQAREQEIYIHEAMLRDQKTRAFRHDIKNHLLVLAQLLKNGQADQACTYLQNLQEGLAPLSTSIHTGNAAADALLGSKAAVAQQKGIDLSCRLSLPKASPVPDTDWCIVLANAVDNGIHACNALLSSGQSSGQAKNPYIRIQGRQKGDLFLLIVENSCDPQLTAPPADGIGLSNIRAVAEKHRGAFQNQVSGGVYRLDLLFPLSPTEPCDRTTSPPSTRQTV
ncbi:MAG: GHKL domain-containing protein [Lachnospiraceae bacterium]|nr:GHKL domain-containing protein [Lachnospiraceae bacterium]